MTHEPAKARLLRSLAPVVLFGVAALGCDKIPVEMHTTTVVQHADGKVERKDKHWRGTLDQLPAQMSQAGKELGEVTAKMAKELTDVPPPGHVELKDISPELERWQGKEGADFIANAKDADGKPITFQYVKLGQPSYDEFFKTSQEIYALVYQTTQIIAQMKQGSSKVLGKNVEGGEGLKQAVDNAREKASQSGDPAQRQLERMTNMAQVLSTLIPQIAQKLGKLVQTGEALIAGAATSITNPKVVTHLGLVKDGLTDSIKVIKESTSLMAQFSKDLSGFGKS